MCAFLLVGCTTKEDKDTATNDLTTIDEKVKKEIDGTTEFSRDKIDEAVTYIHENRDNMKDSEVSKKVYEYSVYLENAAKNGANAANHDISKFASKTKEYATNVYTASKDEVDNIINDSKDAIHNMDDDINKDKDKFVDEFHKLVNNK